MNIAPHHAQDFTPEEYTRFRAVLKTQAIMKKDQVPLFFIYDMVVDDRDDKLRFKLAYMPPMLRGLDVHLSKTDSKVTLSWQDPILPAYEYVLHAITLFLVLTIVVSTPTFRINQFESLIFPAAMVLWSLFCFFLRKRQLREGGERFAKAMESMSNRARHEAEQSTKTVTA